jgi:hypothetical protein
MFAFRVPAAGKKFRSSWRARVGSLLSARSGKIPPRFTEDVMTLEWVARPTCLILVTRTTDFTCLPIFADELAGQKSLRDSEDRGGARVRARPPGITQCQLVEGKDSIAPRSPEKEDSPNWKPFVGNPAGNQSRPPKPGQSAYGGEASLAWWVGNYPCEA